MDRRLIAIAGIFLALAGVPLCRAQAPEAAAAASASSTTPEVTSGTLYIFNDSGPTLIPSNQFVTDNGIKLAGLPRQTYLRVELAPGRHLLKPDPPLWKQQVALDVIAGNRYFVVIAYRPERSWAWPIAEAPLMLRELTEAQAAPLLKEMKAR